MDKKTFKEKWKDKKYQAKVKLSGYGSFVVIAIILIIIGSINNSNTNSNYTNNDNTNDLKENNNISIKIDYPYVIELNYTTNEKENKISYSYMKKDNEILITKTNNDLITNYKYIDNKYYIENNNNYILTTINKIYDINYDYLDIDNINNYLTNSTFINDKYIIYLKDIILNNDSNLYITINIIDNIIEIDYTNLFNTINNIKYDNYIVKIYKNTEEINGNT